MEVTYNGKTIRLKGNDHYYSKSGSRRGYEIYSADSSNCYFIIDIGRVDYTSKKWSYQVETNGESIEFGRIFRDEDGYDTVQDAFTAAVDSLMKYIKKFNRVMVATFGEAPTKD